MSERTSVRPALLAALIGGLLLAPGVADGQSWRTVTSSRQLQDSEPVKVEVEYGAGKLEIGPAERSLLYRMELRYDAEQFTPVTRFDAASRSLRLGTAGREGRGDRGMNVKEGATARISLSRAVPLDLTLAFGAGEADIELGGMRLRSLDLSTGASETSISFAAPNPLRAERVEMKAGAAALTVLKLGNTGAKRFDFQGGVGSTTLDFGGRWTGDAVARVQIGVGSVKLRFPRSLGIRLTKSSFLTSFDGAGLVRRGGSYYSRNWESAAHQLTVEVDAAFGAVEVEWTDS